MNIIRFNKYIYRFTFLFILTSLHSWAGNEVGNGGDAVVCSNKVEILDYHSAYEEGITIENYDEASHIDLIEKVTTQYSKVDIKLAQYLKRMIKKGTEQLIFKEGIVLEDIKDSKHLSIAKDCSLKQMAIKKKLANGNERYIIDQDLWKKLSSTHKAGLLIHEYLYSYFAHLGEKDSRKVRLLNAWIMSNYILLKNDSLLDNTKKKYIKFIREIELPHYP